MSARYLALLGSQLDFGTLAERVASVLSAQGWSMVGGPFCTIFLIDAPRRSNLAGAPIIIGDIYPRVQARGDTSVDRQFDSGDTYRQLRDEFWGDFIAVVGADSVQPSVYRSPLGRLGCYFRQCRSVTVAASDIDVLRSTDLLPGEFDLPAVAEHLLYPHFRSPRTAFAGLRELLGGERLRWSSATPVVDAIWSPWDVVSQQSAVTDPVEAAHLVRTSVVSAVSAIAKRHGKIVLGVSGGLDSSIVAAGLSTCGADFSLMTLATRDPRGDERDFARILAKHLGRDLEEATDVPDHIDVTMSDALHLPRPIARSFAQSGDRAFSRVADRLKASSFFSGAGGDNVFCYLRSAAPIADRWLRCELLGSLRTAVDIAALTKAGVANAWRTGFRRAFFRRRAFRWPKQPLLLSSRAIELASAAPEHPWLQVPRGGLPGTAAHIAQLIGIENHLEGFARERIRPLVSPLMALPIVEACLRIPSWLWCTGGINRAVARAAFGDLLPTEIIGRVGKGSPDGLAADLFIRSRQALAGLLLTGVLATEGFLDVAATRVALETLPPLAGDGWSQVLALADVEAWLRGQRSLKSGSTGVIDNLLVA